MEELKIEYVDIDELQAYEKNAKLHDKKQIDQIVKSIQQFGMNDPIGVWKDNVVVEGHGRLMACKKMGMKKVPIIRLEHMSDEERRAYVLVHNQLTMATGWDSELLEEELVDIEDIDMFDFGFELDFDFSEKHEEFKEETNRRLFNIENLDFGQYNGEGPYNIPMLEPVFELPEITEWISFNYVLSDENPEGKGVHFFIDDYQFERVWNTPEKYLDKLRQYACVATPDFSPYGDMPMALQIYNHYRKHWCGKYWQENGITVIPTIRASSDPRSLEWFLDGTPQKGIIMTSSMWDSRESTLDINQEMTDIMLERLKPKKIFVYGSTDRTLKKYKGDVQYIPTFTSKYAKKDE